MRVCHTIESLFYQNDKDHMYKNMIAHECYIHCIDTRIYNIYASAYTECGDRASIDMKNLEVNNSRDVERYSTQKSL